MVRRSIFLEEGIGLHPYKVIDVWERGLDDAVIVGNVGKLRIDEVVHQLSGLVRAMCLVKEVSVIPMLAKR